MKKSILFQLGIVGVLGLGLSSCGSGRCGRSQEKQYEHAQQVYHDIVQEYASELELCMNHQLGADQIRRSVLTHADGIRKQLGLGSYMTGRFGRYTSYPFLEYTRDLDDAVQELNKTLRRLVLYDADYCVKMCQQIQELRQYLQVFRTYVISNDRYLVEQDKWDKVVLEQNKQATLNAMLAQTMKPKQVHVYHNG